MTNILKKLVLILILFMHVDIVCANIDDYGASVEAKLNSISSNIYSYDLSWGDMSFNYVENENYVFNDATNDYKKVISGSWDSSSNEIEIQNNGIGINVMLSYDSDINSVSGNFTDNSFYLSFNESKKVYLNLSGTLGNSYTSYTKVGSILIEVE